jgi:putative transport protein
LLITSIVVAFLSSRNPTFGRVPATARRLIIEPGLVFFRAGAEPRSTDGVVGVLRQAGPGPRVYLTGLQMFP